jgi:nucleoid-associated protein YgaU
MLSSIQIDKLNNNKLIISTKKIVARVNRIKYSTTLTKRDTKKMYLSSVIYPKIKASNDDMYVISDIGDRLDILALKYYGDQSLWWIIATANNLNEASYSITPGIQLRIPANVSKILNDLEKINK